MGLFKASGEFFRELLDTHGRILLLGTIVVALGGGTLVSGLAQAFLHVHGLFLWTVGLFASGAFILVAAAYVKKHPASPSKLQGPTPASAAVQELAIFPGVPTQQAGAFDFRQYFRLAHVSQLTDQTERDIINAAAQQCPNDRETVLAKFIGIGFWGYMHEITWAYIFRSQVLALTELNTRGGLATSAVIRAHYDKAAIGYPDKYSRYSFQQWMDFMRAQALFLHHPSDMVEITLRGRDFLKFITHWGWNAYMREY